MLELKKYKNQEIEVGLMLPTSFSTKEEEHDGRKFVVQESNFDNCIEGRCIEATNDSMVVEAQHRSKIYRYEIPGHSIAFILTTTLSESGQLASERMKQLHKKETSAK